MGASALLGVWILMRIVCQTVLSVRLSTNRPTTPKNQYKWTTYHPSVHQKLSFTDANTACKQKGQYLPLPQSTTEQMNLLDIMNKREMNITWLRTVWKISKHWRLLSGARYDGNVLQASPDNYCAALGNSGVYARNCFNEVDGFICQLKGDGCKPVTVNKGECVTISNETTSWFEANMKCAILGGSLLYDEDLMKDVNKPSEGRTYHWFGVTRGSWSDLSMADMKVNSRLQWTNWRPGIRKAGTSSCVVVNKDDGHWDPVPCHENHPFVCVKGHEPGSSGIITKVLLGCIGVCTMFVLPFAALRCMRSRCKDRQTNQSRINWRTNGDFPLEIAPSQHPNMWSEDPCPKKSPQSEQLSMSHLDDEEVFYGTPIDAITSEFSCGPAPVGIVQNKVIRY